MYKNHTICRACGSDQLIPVADFGLQPLANDFKRHDQQKCGHYPLKVLHCKSCTLGQLSVVVDPRVLYSSYSYVTSTSQTMVEHFDRIIADLCSIHGNRHLGRVLEIGSNNGAFLRHVRPFAKHVVGVDPATNLCEVTKSTGVECVNALWCSETAASMTQKFDTIVARHVFAHCDDWKDFVVGLEVVTHKDSVVFIEVPHAQKLIERCEFDTIYHEHLSYVTVRSINALLRESKFQVVGVIPYGVHGGSIGIVLKVRGFSDTHCSLGEVENDNVGVEDWLDMNQRRIALVDELAKQIASADKPLIGYGAPAKLTLWANLLGLTSKQMMLVHDTTPQKFGCLVPGTDIPVVEYSPSLNEGVKTAVMWCWNYEEEVVRKEWQFIKAGGRFILPLGKQAAFHKVNS